MINKEDLPLIARKKKAYRIFKAPYRKGINYLRLMDIMQECGEQLRANSFKRVFND